MLSRLTTSTCSLLGRILRPSVTLTIAMVLIAALFVHLLSTGSPMPFESRAEAQIPKEKRTAAPDLIGGTDWLNTPDGKALTLKDLQGRIVLLDFWTLCCINCIHIMPDLAKLEARYPGILVVIGVHSPKFENEKKTESIKKAVLRYELKHPIVNDINHKIWDAYGVRSWPSFALIDPEGKFAGYTNGEGQYDNIERSIKALIKEYESDPAKKAFLKRDPLDFKLISEKPTSPLFFPGKVLADDASKRIFIADSTNHRIVITNLEGKKIAIAGSGKEGFKDGSFADAQFSDPQGMTLDGETLYVADRKNHSIRALNLKDQTVKIAAGTGQQEANFGSRHKGGAALAISLNSPWDLLLVDRKIYIAMAGHHMIWTFDLAKDRVDAYAGNGQEAVVDGSLADSAFAQPSGLATDGKRLFVADSESSSIRAMPLVGNKGVVTTVVGVSGPNENLFNFGDKNGVGRNVRLQHALGVAYHQGKLYVADTYNSKIKIIDPGSRACNTWLGEANAKTFFEPGGVCIAGGIMYVADTNNHRIQVVDMKTKESVTLRLQGVDPVAREAVASKESK
jgi:thiol-disulfide isomerase/thioredoxin